jgi:hypothetical protein
MSIHSAKGLEFDNVFLLGLEEGIFPYERKGDDSGCDLEEERRLAYVAITRARKQLFLLRSMSRTLFGFSRPNPASRFLRDLPREDVAGIVTDNAGMSMPGGRAPIRPVASPSWSQGSPFRPRPAPAPPPRPAPRPEPDEHGRVIERDPSSFIDDDGGLRKGTRVKHQRFGVGTVVSADTSSQPPRATVYFASWGEKKVLLEHLMPLGLLQNLRKRSNNPPPCHEPPSAARLSAMRAKTPFDMLPTTSVRGAIHVVVESPAGSRNKYKYDPKLGLFRLNRVLPYEASFPFDYGFTPNTRSGDKDPLDVMLLGDAPTFPGCVVRAPFTAPGPRPGAGSLGLNEACKPGFTGLRPCRRSAPHAARA